MTELMLETFRLKNFKGVRDSGEVRFTPLTAFIGYNGVGKSNLIDGLQTFREIVVSGLDHASSRWGGYEYILNAAGQSAERRNGKQSKIEPIEFTFAGTAIEGGQYQASMAIGLNPKRDEFCIEHEQLNLRGKKLVVERNNAGQIVYGNQVLSMAGLSPGMSMFSPFPIPPRSLSGINVTYIEAAPPARSASWQFLTLNPYEMGMPKPQMRTLGKVRLNSDGSNIAEYLMDIRKKDRRIFDGILDTLQFVLPYARDLQPVLTSELERVVYLQLTEGRVTVPGWLLSTGTLRLVSILAVLRSPEPPPLIVIEEFENGLDPRTLYLLIEEIRNIVDNGVTQVVITTHSPYLLDLLSLSQIIMVERSASGEPVFSRPADRPMLAEWSKTVSPGKLYIGGKLGSVSIPENEDM